MCSHKSGLGGPTEDRKFGRKPERGREAQGGKRLWDGEKRHWDGEKMMDLIDLLCPAQGEEQVGGEEREAKGMA